MPEGRKNWKDRIDKRCSTFSSNLLGEMKRVEKRGSQLLIQDFPNIARKSHVLRFTVRVRGEELLVGTKLGFTKWGATKV